VDIRVDNASLDNDRIISVYGIAFLFLFTVIVGTVLIMICGESATDSIALVISSITNFGPGFGDFGPMGSCQTLEPAAKLILSGIMWMGRLEVLAALALVMPSF
jgi:trk system potassium uptake protein TrkH